MIRFHRGELAVRENALRLVIDHRRIGIVGQRLGGQVDAERVGLVVVIHAEGEPVLVAGHEVLRLQRRLEGQLGAGDDGALVGQARHAIVIDDVGFQHARGTGRHFAREGGGTLRPGDVQAGARRHRPFRRLHVQRHGRLARGGIEHEHPAIGAGLGRVLQVILRRPRQQDMAVRQIERPGEAIVGKVRGQVADLAAGDVVFQHVAESLGDKQHLLAVEREFGPFAKAGQLLDIGRQVLVGRDHAARGHWRRLLRQQRGRRE